MPLPLVIVNPASRGGEAARDWPRAASALRTYFGPFDCRFTEHRGHAVSIACEEAIAGRAFVLTFGGDGTISEVARGILESGKPAELGILPHGTGGDLVRSLSLPARPEDAARAIRRGRTVSIDVGHISFSGGAFRTFVNTASFGLSAEVARRVHRSDERGYALETVRAALDYGFPEVILSVDGAPARKATITTVSLHNGRFFGGGMKMAPDARVDDGRLDVVVVRKLPVSRLLRHAPLLYLGAHLGLEEVEHGHCRRLVAAPSRPGETLPVEVDGEVDPALSLPATFEIRPRALRVRLPPSAHGPFPVLHLNR